MARTPKDVTDAELAILQMLWERAPVSTRELSDVLYPGGGTSEYATVQKLCERLEAKDYVVRDRGCRPHRFAAAVDRDALIGRQLRSVADKLCGGEFAPLLNHLVQDGELSPDDIEGLRDLVDKLDADSRPRRRRGRSPR